MSEALPDFLAEIAEEIGEAAALRLAHEFGGVRCYVPLPTKLRPQHKLAQAVGLVTAQKFAQRFGPGHIIIPFGPTADGAERRRRVVELARQGLSNAAIARRTRLNRRTVQRILAAADARPSDRQADLFADDRRPA